jgi:predicted DNA repair protein MutK
MSILFTIFVAVGLLLGWIRDLSSQAFARQFLVWSCVLTSLVFGFFAELLVARWRFDEPGKHRWRRLFGHIATNWLLALSVSAIALALLALPVFDSMRVVAVVVSVIVIEFVVVCSIASVINARRQGLPRTRSAFLRGFGNYALLNAVSMVLGVAAGRLYLNLFYPGVG